MNSAPVKWRPVACGSMRKVWVQRAGSIWGIVVSVLLLEPNAWYTQFKGGEIYWGSWFQRVHPVVSWLQCRSIMATGCGRAKLVTSWWQSRDQSREQHQRKKGKRWCTYLCDLLGHTQKCALLIRYILTVHLLSHKCKKTVDLKELDFNSWPNSHLLAQCQVA